MKNFIWFANKYIKPHWLKIVVVFILGIIVSATSVAIVQFVRPMLDDVFIEKDMEILKFISIGIIFLFIISGITRYLHFSMKKGLGELMTMHFRNDLYVHLLKLPLGTHSKHHSGAILAKVLTDAGHIPKGIMMFLDLVREPLTFLGFLLTALWANWKLTLIILLVAPIVIFMINKVGITIKRYTNRNLEQFGILGIALNETFSGMKIIKAFSIEALMKVKFLNINKRLYKFLYKTRKIEELSTPLVEFVGSIVAAVVIYIGGSWVISGNITQGEFMTILVALGLAQQPIKKINSSNMKFQTALAAITRIKEVFNMPVEKTQKGLQLNSFAKSIIFNNVSFEYPGENIPVLNGINMEIKKGEIVALVGASGSGKTTVANLIPRFFEVTGGEILIDGENINNFSIKSLRNSIAVVSQDTFLFNDTVSMNILSGRRTASKDEVLAAAKSAFAYDFINEFPERFETELGERGTRLSGGEKQRITIARALIKNAPILILDEATSSLDTVSEIQVQKALNRLMENKTTLVIAHRLSTIKNANRILVIEKGRIIQEGKHTELIKIEGPYKNFHDKQWEDRV